MFIDPFDDLSALGERMGVKMDYPRIEGVPADLVLVTHEHVDHNGVEVIEGDPAVLRATPGRHESPVGEVIAIASEHDPEAGTRRGPNTILLFDLDGVRVAHFGDFGQRSLREEQTELIGSPDLLLLPVGGGPTIGGEQAAAIVDQLRPRWVVPMHYRTERIGFLEPADDFLERMAHVQRLTDTAFETDELHGERPLVVVPATP